MPVGRGDGVKSVRPSRYNLFSCCGDIIMPPPTPKLIVQLFLGYQPFDFQAESIYIRFLLTISIHCSANT